MPFFHISAIPTHRIQRTEACCLRNSTKASCMLVTYIAHDGATSLMLNDSFFVQKSPSPPPLLRPPNHVICRSSKGLYQSRKSSLSGGVTDGIASPPPPPPSLCLTILPLVNDRSKAFGNLFVWYVVFRRRNDSGKTSRRPISFFSKFYFGLICL